MTSDSRQARSVQDHLFHSQQYLDNALALLDQGEAAKAGELLWGSVAQAAHALAAARNREVKTHRDLKNFVIQVSRELDDDNIRKDFGLAEYLHANFYVIERTVEDIALELPVMQELRQRLFSLIPPELLEPQQASP